MQRMLILFFAAVLTAGGALAQAPEPDMAAALEEASRKFEEWLEATGAFVSDVTFDEDDVKSLLELWPEFSELGEEFEEHEEDEEGLIDYRKILADERYRRWAASHGVPAEPWLKKTTRILSMVMRGQMEAAYDQAEAELPRQLKEIESQRRQIGEKMYQQMKRSMEASAEIFKRQRAAWAKMPSPTAAEQALLDEYQVEFMALMTDDEAEEEWR